MSEIRTQSFTDDGRRAELVVKSLDNGCEKQTVTEIYVEPKVEKKLAKVVVEDQKPFIYKRTTQTVDETTGEILEQVEEDLDPGTKLKVVDHIVSAVSQPVRAASAVDDCYVTRDELLEVVTALNGRNASAASISVSEDAPRSIQNLVAQRVTEGKSSYAKYALQGVIVAQIILVAYIFFGRG